MTQRTLYFVDESSPAYLHTKEQIVTSQLPRDILAAEIETYHRDGVVMLKSIFDSEWIDILTLGLAKNCESPTHRARIWDCLLYTSDAADE